MRKSLPFFVCLMTGSAPIRPINCIFARSAATGEVEKACVVEWSVVEYEGVRWRSGEGGGERRRVDVILMGVDSKR